MPLSQRGFGFGIPVFDEIANMEPGLLLDSMQSKS